MTFEEIDGVGSKTAKKLIEAGFTTMERLATATRMELTELGFGEKTIDKLLKSAINKIFPEMFVSAKMLMEQREKELEFLTTGSNGLDAMLGGGVETGSITEIAGPYGSGKSQLCHQLTVNTTLPKEQGGLDGDVLFFDTENTFRPKRVVEMAGGNLKVLERITVSKCYTSDHQVFLLNHCDKIIEENKVRLIVVDSIITHFRSEYIGRELLAPRQQKLNNYLKRLVKFAVGFNLAVVVTNQAVANPQFFGATRATGGNIMGHASTTRMILRRPKTLASKRIARLTESPWRPTGECVFRITEKGVEDELKEKKEE